MAKAKRERYEVEWQELTEGGKIRHLDADYEHDRDRDEQNVVEVFHTLEKARERAKQIRKRSFYGVATIQLQRYLPIEGTVHYDWEPIGEPEYVE